MTRTDIFLLWAAIALGALGIVVAIDLLYAVASQSCASPRAGPGCYPWGTEGPAAGSWRYASKANYVFSGIAITTLSLATLASVVWMRSRRRPLTGSQRTLVVIAFAGTTVLTFL